jgi:hypothetical protein
MRRSLADGHPVLIRLHPAAAYPAPAAMMQKNDLEGHATLVVGYDDDKRSFALLDPWQNRWGGARGGLRWISYSQLQMEIVDSTLDYMLIPAPLVVQGRISRGIGNARVLNIFVSFYKPHGIVMDQDNQVLREVKVTLEPNQNVEFDGPTTSIVKGVWPVGKKAHVSFALAHTAVIPDEIIVNVQARIAGSRPYPFEDTTSTRAVCPIAILLPQECATEEKDAVAAC